MSCNFSVKYTAVLSVSTGCRNSKLSKQTLYPWTNKYTSPLAQSGLVILPVTSSNLNITCFGNLIAPKCLCKKSERWMQSAEFSQNNGHHPIYSQK